MLRPRCHRLCRECGALVAPSPAGAREGLTGKHLTSDDVTCAGSAVTYVDHPLRPELRSPPPPSPRERVALLVAKAHVVAGTSGDAALEDLASRCLAAAHGTLAALAAEPVVLPAGVASLQAYRMRRAGGAR